MLAALEQFEQGQQQALHMQPLPPPGLQGPDQQGTACAGAAAGQACAAPAAAPLTAEEAIEDDVLLEALLQYERDGGGTPSPAPQLRPPRDPDRHQARQLQGEHAAQQQQEAQRTALNAAIMLTASQPGPQEGAQKRPSMEVWEKLL